MSDVLAGSAEVDLAALLVRVADGDDDAFARVYDATSAAAYGMALRVSETPRVADQVLQEVFLHVWEHAATFDPARGGARAWIVRLAHRHAVDRLRLVRATAADDPTAEVRGVLEIDGTDRAQVVALAYFSGYSQPEIAGRTGIPLRTVKALMREDLTRLRGVSDAARTTGTNALG